MPATYRIRTGNVAAKTYHEDKMNTNEGYVTLACGSRKYLDLAINLTASIRRWDGSRPICLVHDEHLKLTAADRRVFDHCALMESDPDFVGCANKLRLFDFSPYEKSFYIDSDCLVVKPDMERHWKKFAGTGFNVAGGKRTSGHWYNFDIAEACSRLNIKYMVQMNAGVIYFTRDGGKPAFDEALRLYREARDVIGSAHQKRLDQLADEPFFGAAMGSLEIEPVGYAAEEGSIMITTLYARRLKVDLGRGMSQIEKPSGFYVLNRLFAKSWVKHSPTIVHFIALKPRKIYDSLVSELLQAAAANPGGAR